MVQKLLHRQGVMCKNVIKSTGFQLRCSIGRVFVDGFGNCTLTLSSFKVYKFLFFLIGEWYSGRVIIHIVSRK